MAKKILFNEEARSAIKKGIDKLAEAVKMTLIGSLLSLIACLLFIPLSLPFLKGFYGLYSDEE